MFTCVYREALYIYEHVCMFTCVYREALFKAVGEERGRLEVELKRREQLLVTHREWRASKSGRV